MNGEGRPGEAAFHAGSVTSDGTRRRGGKPSQVDRVLRMLKAVYRLLGREEGTC